MQVLIDEKARINKRTAICLGNFDGLHIGHRQLVNTMFSKAKENNLVSVVFTFLKHTTRTIESKKYNNLIINNNQKIKIINDFGVDILYMINFNENIMNLSAKDFIKKYLVDGLDVKLLVVGFNFRFGYKGEGNTETLKELGKEYGFEVIVLEPVKSENIIVSSTYIRGLIREGKISKTNELLKRPYTVLGKVVKGKSRGKKLGYPTANLQLSNEYVLPKRGIYKTLTRFNDKEYLSVTSVGSNPTFGNNQITIETYILNFDKDIYNKELEISFLEYLRDEMKFHNEMELIKQIEKDVSKVKGII